MYRRSRSPEYRNKPYSPSRPLSPGPSGPPPRSALPSRPRSPPSRHGGRSVDGYRPEYEYDSGPRSDRYAPAHGRYSPPQRYGSPPRGRYTDDEYGRYGGYDRPPRRDDDQSRGWDDRGARRPRSRSRSPPPHPRQRDWDHPQDREERHDSIGRMVVDRFVPPPRVPPPAAAEVWERGRNVDELDAEYDESARGRSGHGRGATEPSKDVIFLGLDPELTEYEFMGYLVTEHAAQVESVKIVTDRTTGISKGFGFANFVTIEDAEDFVNANYSGVLMPALHAHSQPRKVKIDFSAPNPDSLRGVQHAKPGSDGMSDIGSAAGGNRVLLLRSLNFHTSPEEIIARLGEEIARMVGKQGREKEAEAAVCRVALIVDAQTKSRWGYAFVELITAELASALLAFLISPETQPNGFVIHDYLVAAMFMRPEAFQPVAAGLLGGENLVQATRRGGIGSTTIDKPDGKWVGYWHEQAGVVIASPKNAPPIEEDGSVKVPTGLRGYLGSLAGPPPGQQAGAGTAQGSTTSAPVSISMTAMQPIKIGVGAAGGKKRGVEEEGFVAAPPKNLLGEDDDEPEPMADSVLKSRTKGVGMIIAPSSRKVAKNISKWNTKSSELKAPEPVSFGAPKGISAANAVLGVKSQPGLTTASASTSTGPAESGSRSRPLSPATLEDDFDYADLSTLATTGKVACLLCQRRFPSVEALKKHNAGSDLHKANLAKPEACSEGKKRKNEASATSTTNPAPSNPAEDWGSGSGAVYRDRAAERRIVHHQPDRPSPLEINLAPPAKRKFDAPKPPSPPPEAVAPGQDASNKGNMLLAKMGWKEGTGLGAAADGRVDPVLVQQYESRVGLGKTQGRDPARWDGPEGFKRRALDMAKERYESGGK